MVVGSAVTTKIATNWPRVARGYVRAMVEGRDAAKMDATRQPAGEEQQACASDMGEASGVPPMDVISPPEQAR